MPIWAPYSPECLVSFIIRVWRQYFQYFWDIIMQKLPIDNTRMPVNVQQESLVFMVLFFENED